MSERQDGELRELLRAARPEPPEGWRERTLARMRGAGERRRGSRLRWVPTALGAALVVAALALAPYSAGTSGGAGQAAYAAQAFAAEARAGEEPAAAGRTEREALHSPLEQYARRAPAFVRALYSDDPEMLIAAGMLTRDLKEAQELLKSAVEKGGGGAAWAAYAEAVMEAGPGYYRVAIWGVDPTDPEAVTEAKREIDGSGVPGKLTPEETAPVLEVLRQWEKAEPRNGLPIAFEMHYLYGLHRDDEALARWEEAAARPRVESYTTEHMRYAARLLQAMGMSPWEAVTNSAGASTDWEGLTKLRNSARIGVYEGRLAEIEGRNREAIRWWTATFTLGRHTQESADSLIQELEGIAIEGVGAAPVWMWWPDRATGIPDGPLLGGRLFYGKSHAFFVREAGQQKADEIRDSMVRAKVRSMLAREYVKGLGAVSEGELKRAALLGVGVWSAALLVAALAGFGVVSLWARRRANEATRLGWRGRVVLALVALSPLAVGLGLALATARTAKMILGLVAGVFGGPGLSFILLLLLPLGAAFWSRAPEAGVLSAWRGNLRKVLPLAAVGLAVISLVSVMTGRAAEARWARSWVSQTEIKRMEKAMGPKWTHPKIPPDSWRNEPPPEVEGG